MTARTGASHDPATSAVAPVASESDPWWRVPDLAGVWRTICDRLERRGLVAEGRVVLRGLDRAERHAVGDLLGRPVAAERVTIDLATLDARLGERAGLTLVEACAQAVGSPLVDRRAAVRAGQARAAAPREAAERWLADHPEVDWPWVDPWLARLRRDGHLGRDGDPAATVRSALEVLWSRRGALAASPAATVARTDLAAVTCHDAHALDDDRRLGVYVLRAVSLARGLDVPSDAFSRRAAWAEIGVLPDSVSATCLVWHLSVGSTDADGRPVPLDTSMPFHLTWWHVRAGLRIEGGGRVLVCENPRVLEAIAEDEVDDLGVVCTSGRPNLVTQHVLAKLASSSTRLLYHGDLDWPGVAMANDAAARWGARPWRMSVHDYEAAPGALPLGHRVVDPAWDDELGAAMRRRGVAVHEEAVLDELLASL